MSDKIHEIVAAYLAGESVSEEEQQVVERWLQEHAGEKDVELLQGMFWSSRLMREKAVGRKEFVFERMEKEVWRRQRNRRIGWYYSGVAVVAVLLGVALMFWRSGMEAEDLDVPGELQKMDVSKAYLKLNTGEVIELDKYQGVMIREDSIRIANADYTLRYSYDSVVPLEVKYDTLMIPRGSEYSIVLTDGTKVFLNAGSEIYYPVAFSGDQREVGLKGEAYFEVSKNKEKPFLVQVDDMSVKVYGTEFNVNTYNNIETVLVTGSVSMNQGGKEVLLKPNQKGVFDQVSGKITVADVDVLAYVSWKNGDFIFRNESLNSIMDKLSRWYGLEVLYQDARLQNVRLSGNLKRYKDVRELFVSFEKISDARFKVQGNKVIVSSK